MPPRIPSASYGDALAELATIRDQLVPGGVGPGDVEVLAARAATVFAEARAALYRAGGALDDLASALSGPPRPDIGDASP